MSLDLRSKIFKVRPDVFFVRSDDGVWLRNNVGSFFIKGGQAYQLVRSLLTQLDGTRTVDEVCRSLGSVQSRVLYERLLEPLAQRGFFREIHALAEPVPPWLEASYQEPLSFLELYVDQPMQRLMKLRSQPVVCIGSGLLLRALMAALADLGFARVHVLTTDTGADAAALRDVIAAVAQVDARAEWMLALHPAEVSLEGLVAAATAVPASGVVLATASAQPAEITAAAEALRGRGCPVAVMTPAGGVLVASPLLTDEPWCWECLYRSVVSDVTVAPAPPSAALAAFQVAQRLFCRLAGPPVPEDRRVSTVDCRTLAVQGHTPRRHATCARHGHTTSQAPVLEPVATGDAPIRPDVPTSHDAAVLVAEQDRITKTVAAWTNELTGPLLSVGEEQFEQMPLSASICRIRGPASQPWVSEVRVVGCRAISPREARNQAILLALEWLAAATARVVGELGNLVAFGAGWSTGEALYRAMAAASQWHTAPEQPVAGRSPKVVQPAASPTRDFLLASLAEQGHHHVEMLVEDLPTGLLQARVVVGRDLLGCGVGVDEEHAATHALTDAVARRTAAASEDAVVAVAHPAPPGSQWGEVLQVIRARALLPYTVLDMGHLAPFLDGQARLVALATAVPGVGR